MHFTFRKNILNDPVLFGFSSTTSSFTEFDLMIFRDPTEIKKNRFCKILRTNKFHFLTKRYFSRESDF